MKKKQIKGLEKCVQKIQELVKKGKSKGLQQKKNNLSKGTIFYYNYALFNKKSE